MLKTEAMDDLVGLVRKAAAGEIVLPPGHLAEIVSSVERAASRRSAASRVLDRLTMRERGILQLLAEGHSNAQIATKLFISPLTVQSHVRNVLAKLGVHSKLEAVTFAIRLGAVSVSGPAPTAARQGRPA
jgi:DNA-binding NarL/FixJ family response regulator